MPRIGLLTATLFALAMVPASAAQAVTTSTGSGYGIWSDREPSPDCPDIAESISC